MQLIPSYYQELETIVQSIQAKSEGCVTFFAPNGGEGVSSLVCSIARRLERDNKTVLIIDLNQFRPMPEEVSGAAKGTKKWCFGDISCQTNVIQTSEFKLLSSTNMRDSTKAREQETVKQAFIRLKQEFDFILVDMCPLQRVNRLNFPSKILADISTYSLFCVALGHTNESDLTQSLGKLCSQGYRNIEVVVSQFSQTPLGPKLLAKIESGFSLFPKFQSWLMDKIKQQPWLFVNH